MKVVKTISFLIFVYLSFLLTDIFNDKIWNKIFVYPEDSACRSEMLDCIPPTSLSIAWIATLIALILVSYIILNFIFTRLETFTKSK